MSKNSFYISFGIWIMIIPFLGVPNTWKTILTVASGIFILVVNGSPIILKKVQGKPARTRKKPESKANIIAPKEESKTDDAQTPSGVVSEYMQEVKLPEREGLRFGESNQSE